MTTWLDIQRQEDPDTPMCTCEDCGKRFRYGTEGDNELICLRCQANFIATFNHGDYNSEY